MFIIASSGRSGSYALCHGLDRFSDHAVLHEPAPQLLTEASLKHSGHPYETDVFRDRMAYFRERSVQKYGESFRAPNLLTEIHQAVPGTKFLILVRNPLEYVVSAHSKRVFQKNDIYDQTRLIPLDRIDGFSSLPLAEKIAWHWVIVNTYLLDFFESDLALARLMTIANLDSQVDEIVDFLGVKITDRSGLSALLNSSPNKKESSILPEGFEPKRLDSITGEIWQKAIKYGQGQR